MKISLEKWSKGSHDEKSFWYLFLQFFGLFAGMLALIVIDYEINYNKWINSRSESQLTNPVQKYSSSSDGNKDDFESSKRNTLLQVLVRRIMIIKILFFKW